MFIVTEYAALRRCVVKCFIGKYTRLVPGAFKAPCVSYNNEPVREISNNVAF